MIINEREKLLPSSRLLEGRPGTSQRIRIKPAEQILNYSYLQHSLSVTKQKLIYTCHIPKLKLKRTAHTPSLMDS